MANNLNAKKLARIIDKNPRLFVDVPFYDGNPLHSYSSLQIRRAIGEGLVLFFKNMQRLPLG